MKSPSRGLMRAILIGAILVVITVILLVVTEVAAFGVADQSHVALSYLSIFLLIAGDAIVPILPGETTLNAASTAAAGGSDLELPLIIIAGALGAIVGDSALFGLARHNRRRVQPQVEEARNNARVMSALDYLGDNRKVVLVFARYVPGLRFVVNAPSASPTCRTSSSCPGRRSERSCGRPTPACSPTGSARPSRTTHWHQSSSPAPSPRHSSRSSSSANGADASSRPPAPRTPPERRPRTREDRRRYAGQSVGGRPYSRSSKWTAMSSDSTRSSVLAELVSARLSASSSVSGKKLRGQRWWRRTTLISAAKTVSCATR